MARIAIENLSKIFKVSKKEEFYAVRDVNLNIEDGELLVLVGPSGSGKTTILRMIAGLEEISKGTISIDGTIVNPVAPKDRDVAMVFQNYALFPHLTVYENLALGLKLRKHAKPEIEQRVREAAQILGLSACLDRLPDALSGGERQRVAVGRALVRKPKVFLFDEPLSNLDARMRVQMRREISKLHTRLGATMLHVTHDQIEAMTLGDRIAVIHKGVIQQVADPITLYNEPANLFVAEFIGSPPMNLFEGTIVRIGDALCFQESLDTFSSPAWDPEAGRDALPRVLADRQVGPTGFVGGARQPPLDASGFILRLADEKSAQLSDYLGKPIVFGIRPEDLTVGRVGLNRAMNEMPAGAEACVELVEPTGSETLLYLKSVGHTFVVRVIASFRAEVDQKVLVGLNACKAHFFDPITGKAIG